MRALAPVVLALALTASAGCGAAVVSTVDDGTITARVKTALVNDPSLDVARIDVATVRGVVTLSGRVKLKDEETRALTLARSVKGVTDVKSNLVIQP